MVRGVPKPAASCSSEKWDREGKRRPPSIILALHPEHSAVPANRRKTVPQPKAEQSKEASRGIFCLFYCCVHWEPELPFLCTNAKICHFLHLLQRYHYYIQCFLRLFSLCMTSETSETVAEKREDQSKGSKACPVTRVTSARQEQMSLGEDTGTQPRECVSRSALKQHREPAENCTGCAKRGIVPILLILGWQQGWGRSPHSDVTRCSRGQLLSSEFQAAHGLS